MLRKEERAETQRERRAEKIGDREREEKERKGEKEKKKEEKERKEEEETEKNEEKKQKKENTTNTEQVNVEKRKMPSRVVGELNNQEEEEEDEQQQKQGEIKGKSQTNEQTREHHLDERARARDMRIMFCHDMAGGYRADSHVQGVWGCGAFKEYNFYHWELVHVFVYFSHHRITVPPPGERTPYVCTCCVQPHVHPCAHLLRFSFWLIIE